MDEEPETQGPGPDVDAEVGDLVSDAPINTVTQLQTFSLFDPNQGLAGLAAGLREASRTS